MNLEDVGSFEAAFAGGDPRTLRNVDAVVAAVLASPARAEELLECVFSDDEIVRLRASDALEKVCRQRPELLAPHVQRLLDDMAAVDQPSVQWHLAQMLAEVELDAGQRTRAVGILRRNLATYDDWIVVNLTLEAFAAFARDDSSLRPELMALLHSHEGSPRKSVAARARKLLAQFEE